MANKREKFWKLLTGRPSIGEIERDLFESAEINVETITEDGRHIQVLRVPLWDLIFNGTSFGPNPHTVLRVAKITVIPPHRRGGKIFQ